MKFRFLFFCLTATFLCSAQPVKITAAEILQIKTTITSFYKWYKTDPNKLNRFKLYKSKSANNGPPYVIDWKVAESYFTYLKQNVPFVGIAFVKNERKAFTQIDAAFKRYPEDEVPAGFDYDRFTDTQEDPSWFWNQLNTKGLIWKIDANGTTAQVVITVPANKNKATEAFDLFCGKVAKESGNWKISKIGCDATVLENNQIP